MNRGLGSASLLNLFLFLHIIENWWQEMLYYELPHTCLHYSIAWKVTFNKKTIRKNTEQDLVLAPRFHWSLFSEPKLMEFVGSSIRLSFPMARALCSSISIWQAN